MQTSTFLEIKRILKKVRKSFSLFLLIILSLATSFGQAPSWIVGTPVVPGTGPLSITCDYGINMQGTVYIVIFNYDASGWNSFNILALAQIGPNYGAGIVATAVVPVNAGQVNMTLESVLAVINANTTHTVWFVAANASGTLQASPIKIFTTTLPCPTPDFLYGLSEPQVCVNKGATAKFNIFVLDPDPNNNGILNNTQWSFDWGDGTTASYTSTADNDIPPLALRTHTYSAASTCNYLFTCTVTNPCGGSRSIKAVAVVHARDLAGEGDGYLRLIDNATGNTTVQICEGTQTVVTIKDNSKWNCQSPSLPGGFTPIPNSDPRNIEWLYGQDPTGGSTNTITGTVSIASLGSAPRTSGRISPSPYGPSSLSQAITIPATCKAGEYFRVYLKNWNKCNWTDPEYISTYIDIQVMSAPAAPTVPNKPICFGGDRTLTVTSAPTGKIEWYSDAGLTTKVAEGTSYVPTNPGVGIYDFYVTDRSLSGLLCRSAATKTTLTIMSIPPTPTISYTSSTGNLVICCDPATQYVTLTASATGTSYKWYKNGIFTGVVTQSITLKFAGEGGNYKVTAVGAGPSYCESALSAGLDVIIYAVTDLAQPVPTTVCEGNNAYFTSGSVDASIQRWQWQYSDDNGVSFKNCGSGKYNGFNTNALTVVNTPYTFNGYLYRVYIDTHHAQGDCRFFSNAVMLTVNQKPTVNAGTVKPAICQGGTTVGLGGSVTGTVLSTTWSTPAAGTFTPNENTLNATWTPPATYFGTAVLTLTADGGVCGLSSASKTQVVYPTAKITTQPSDRAVCVSGNTTFTVVDDGTATVTGRQWKVSTAGIGGPYTNITNGGIYSGATTATLTLTNVTTGYNGYYYQCVLTTTGPCTITSSSALLTVNNNPVITMTVSDQTICSGDPATITMTNSVSSPLTSYQLRNGTTNIGAPQNGNGGTLTFTASPEVTTTYNILATIVSSGCSLQVTDPAVITVNPSPTPVITGNAGPCATFNTSYSTPAFGGHTYLWTIDGTGTIIGSAINPTVTVVWGAPGTGWVRVKETITATGCNTTVIQNVTINPGPPTAIPVISGPVWTCNAQTGVIFNVVPLADASYYLWTVPPGATIVSGQGTPSITVDFPSVTPGAYDITVTPQNGCGSDANVGNWPIDISASLLATISGGTSPICYNTDPGTLTAAGAGGPPGAYTYQWFKDGASFPGETNASYDPGNLIANASFYCAVNSIFTCGPVPTPTVNIVVPGVLTANIGGGTSPICYNTDPGPLTATGGGGMGAGSYTYLWYKDGLSTGITTQSYDPGNLTATSGFYCAVTSATCGTVNTPTMTITVPGILAASISGGTSPICYFSNPGILTANASGGNGFYTYLWYKDGVSSGITTSTYDPGNLTATSSFYCVVTSGTCGTVTTATTTITVPGVLTASISGGTSPICYNTSPGTFTVSASGGTGAYSYMWYKNGLATGITGLTYDPGPLTSTSNIYCSVTSGSCGTVNTSATTITVYDDLTAGLSGGTSPVCYNINPGIMTATGNGGIGTYTYLWYKNGVSTGITTATYDPGNLTTSSTFYCAVTSGSCGTANTPTTTIVVYNDLAASISGGISVICYNTSPGTLTAVASGGTGTYSYLWYKDGVSTGITFQTYDPGNLTALSTQFYCAVTSGTCGTVNTAPLTVSVPGILTATISGGTPSICNNSNPGILTATGGGGINIYTYLWYKNGVSTGITSANYDPGNLTSTSTYYCAITSGTCGTVNTSTTTITVNPNPVVIITNPAAICTPSTVDLTAAAVTAGSTAGLTYTYWTDASATVPYGTPAAATTGTYYIKGTTAAGCYDIKPVTVTVNPTPTVVITNPSAVCAPATIDLTAAAVTAGSTPGLTFSYWIDAGATTPYFSPAVSTGGTYYIKGTTALGCYDIKSVTATVNPKPTIIITNPAAVCSPATVDITAASVTAGSTVGLTWTYWTDVSATVPYPSPGAATSGTYYIKGTTAPGCYDIKPVTVTVNPTPTLVINNPSAVCSPATVDLTAAAVTMGSTPGLTLTYWTDAGATTPYATPSVATTGTYYIKGTTLAGCYDIKSVTVTVNTTPTIVITNPVAVCSPSTVNLTLPAVTAGSTAGLTWTYWTDAGATTPYFSPTIATAGTYYIKGTAASGCYDIRPVTVTVNPTPTVVITNPAAVCSPSTVDITTPAITAGSTGGLTFTYWTDAAATIAYATPATATSGTYYIKGTTALGCYDIKPVTVTVNPTPTLVITNPSAVCSPATVDLTAAAVTMGSTPGLTLTYWTDAGATTPYATPATASAGTYYIKGTTAAGCYDIKSVTVTVNPTPTVVITNPSAVCSPTTINLTLPAVTAGSTAGLTWTYWTDAGATTPYFSATAATSGTYYIKGTTVSGCYDIRPVTVTVNPTPTVIITNPAAVCSPSTVDITAPAITAGSTGGLTYTYWTDAGATIAFATPATATSGTYYIKGTTALGCYDIRPVTVTVNPTPVLAITNPAAVCSPATADLTSAAVTAGSTPGLTLTYWTDAGATIAYATPAAATAGTYYIKGTTAAGCYDIKSVTVTVNTTPTVVITNPVAVCSPATANLTLAAVTAGSTAGLTFSYWTDAGATTPYFSPTIATAGTYYIKGTAASGCYDIRPVTVTVNPTPAVVITNPAAVCSPLTVDITTPAITAGSTGGLIFTYWTDAAATLAYPTPATATSGTYYIKGTTALGCYDIKQVTVTVNLTPTVIITNPAAVCSPATADLTTAAITAGSTAGLTYTYWTDAAATIPYASPAAATAGTWYIKGATVAGCYEIKPVTVTVNITPTVMITNPAAVCSPLTVDITAAAVTAGSTPGLTLTYWTDAAATTPYATPATATSGTYYIKGTTAAGCYDIKAVTVTVNQTPTLVITNPAAVCSTVTTDLTTAAVTAGSTPGLTCTYWTDAAATIPYPTPAAATAGTYYIKGTTAAGCYDIKSVTVTVNPAPTVVITNPSAICSPSTVNLTLPAITAGSTAGLTFSYWTDAAATIPCFTPTIASTGTYYIKGTTASGCYDIKPVTVIVNPTPTVVITNPAAICSPLTVDITAAAVTSGSTPGLTLTYWTDAAATIAYATPATATSGTYYIKGTTALGCYDIKPVTVTVNPTPTLIITNPSAVCSPATVNLTSAAVTAGSTASLILTYWTDAGATIPYATPATATAGTYYIKGATVAGCYDIKAVTVTVNSTPTVIITTPAAVCSPATVNLTLSAVTAGSTAGLTYTYWTDAGATTPYFSATAATSGTYYIKGTTALGCSDIQPVTVTVNPTPTVVITSPAAVCSPSTVDITAPAITAGSTLGLTLTYWTDAGATISYATPATATSGTYYIKGTTAPGCYDIKPVTVTVNPTPTLVITNPSAVCSPATVDLTAAAVTMGSTPGLTLTYWTDAGATTPYATPSVATTGTYYIKGTTLAGCYDIKSVTVTVNPTPTVVITNPSAVCSPATINLTLPAVTAGSTAGLTWTYWTDAGATTPYFSPTIATSGTYYIKGTTALGCYDIKPVTVTVNPTPTVVITNPAAVCSPSTVDITTPAITAGSTGGLTFTYWTDAGATISYATPATATSGTYYIKGTAALGCYDIKPVTVTVNPTPTLVITNPSSVCSPATVDLTAAAVTMGSTPGLTLTYWTDAGATTPYATPATASAGTYYIKGTTAAGCYDIKSVTVTVNTTPTVVITNPAAVCSPSTVNLTLPAVTAGSTAGLTLTYWTDAGATTPYFSATAATSGTYYIKGTTALGCYDIKPVTVTVNPTPTVIITNPAAVCSPSTVDITAPAITAGSTGGLTYTYWTDAGATTAFATPATATSGTYYIKGTTALGCYDIKPVTVTVNTTPTVVITNPAAVCSPSTVNLTLPAVTAGSTAGLTWTYWTDASATVPYGTPAAATTGTYYIKGTTAAGCYDIKSVTVTVNTTPTIVITNPAAVCSPSTVNLTLPAVTAGSTAGLTWTYWTDAGATTPYFSPTIATAGTYYIKGTAASGCYDIRPVTVTVNTTPTVVITNPAAVCSPSTVDITAPAITAGSTGGLTFTYWTDAGATIAYATPATATSGTYYIKGATAPGCYDIKPVTVTINPTPTLVITNPSAVCSPATVDLTAAAVTMGSTPGLTLTYWTDAGATIAYATPATATAGTYYIKGTTAAGCYDIKPVTVTVNPTPTVVITNPAAVCSPATVDLTAAAVTAGSTAGLTFTYWTNAAATLSYPTPAAATAGTYYIKGTTAAGCYDIKQVTATINPVSSITDMTAAICSGGTFTSVPVNGIDGVVLAGTIYSWPTPSVTGGITGGAASGGSMATISGTLVNPTNIVQIATYTVTPISGSCSGTPFYVNVTVNPRPSISTISVPVCSGTGFIVTPVNSTDGIVPAGTTYSWSAPSGSGFTGGTPGSGASSISGVLNNTTNTVQTATYSVTPLSGTCSGTPFNVVVTLDPAPSMTSIVTSSCSGNGFTVSPVNIINGIVPASTSYSWPAPAGAGFTGGAAGSSTNINGTLTNTTSSVQPVIYTVTPVSGSCTGLPFSLTVMLNPKPQISDISSSACSGSGFSVIPVDGTDGIVPAGTVYSWSAPSGTGFTGGASGSGALDVGGTLFNSTNTPQTAVYTVTPVTGSCTGAPFMVTLTINPKPSISAMVDTICSGATFIAIPVNGTHGIVPVGTTFTWSAPVVTGGITGGTASGSPQTDISGTLVNPSGSMQKAVYTVTPLSGSCTGSAFTVTVTVKPVPSVVTDPGDMTVCEFKMASFSVTATGGSDLIYQWYVDKNDGNGFIPISAADGTYFGSTTSKLNISGAFRLMNGFKYHVVISDCSASDTSGDAVLYVNNNAEILTQPEDSTICLNGNATFTVSAAGTAINYQWQKYTGAGFMDLSDDINFGGSNTNTLAITNAPASFNNNIFRVFVIGSCGDPVYSNFASLKVNTPPSVLTDPASMGICAGDGVIFNANGTGKIDSIRWQVFSGGIWSYLYDNSIYSGSTLQQLTLTGIPLSFNGYQYRLAYMAKCTTVYSNSATLSVNANPVVDFSAIDPLYACGNTPLVLNGNPSGGSGTWVSHNWSGDTQPLDKYNIQSPTFNTGIVNTYVLNYKVRDSNGCSGNDTITVIVESPDASFTFDKNNGCTPLTVTFGKVMTGIIKFRWDFDDGSPADSVNANPVHVFTNVNPASVEFRNVKLTVRSANGCSSTFTSTITIYPAIDATFSAMNDTICSGSSITFTAATPGANKYFWEFGDGATGFSAVESTSHLYTNFTSAPVIDTVRLTTTSFYNCVDVKTLIITVMPVPAPAFSPVPAVQVFNTAGNPVTFTNETNAGAWTWLWKFGDNSTSGTKDPVHTYTNIGNYNVTLIVSNSNCSDSVRHIISILPVSPVADFDSVMSGCAPLTINLNNTSVNADAPGTTFKWSFGDGSTSTARNPTYTYMDAGNFMIELTVSGPGGTSTKSRVVNSYASPRALFEATPMKVFANDTPVRFFNLSQGADYYLWVFGDGDTSHVTEPYHKYMEEGTYEITLWAYSNNGCYDRYVLSPGVVVEPAGELKFPTVFRPNLNGPVERTDLPTGGPEVDQFFYPPVREKVMEYKLQVFNRLGVLIFESRNINVPWNGYYKGTLCPQGVYVWCCEGKFLNGMPFRKVGDVTLLH